MIGLLLFELLRILYFREFLILRANIDEIEKIKKTDLLSDCAYLLSKFGQNRSSRFRDIAGTKTLRTDERTDEQTDGRHRKLIVDYPQATFNSTKVIWSKSVQPFPRYRVVARGCPWLHVRPKRTYVVLTHRNLITGNLMTIPTYRENFIKIS